MTLASFPLAVIGGVCIGMTLFILSKHRVIGLGLLLVAAACLTIAALGSTVTIPRITVNPHPTATTTVTTPATSPTVSPVPSPTK